MTGTGAAPEQSWAIENSSKTKHRFRDFCMFDIGTFLKFSRVNRTLGALDGAVPVWRHALTEFLSAASIYAFRSFCDSLGIGESSLNM
jgi:hypothetical protein